MREARAAIASARLGTPTAMVGAVEPIDVWADMTPSIAREAWRTVAIATAGMTLAWLLAVPLTLLSVRALSISALSGRMATAPALYRKLTFALLDQRFLASEAIATEVAALDEALGADLDDPDVRKHLTV